MAAFGTDLYPEDKVIDQRIATNGFAYWKGFRTQLESHFRSYVYHKLSGSGWALFQKFSLFHQTGTFLVPNGDGLINEDDPLDSFTRHPICLCNSKGKVENLQPGEYVMKQLLFFIPYFISEFNKIKSQLRQYDEAINNSMQGLHGLKTTLATLLQDSDPEPPMIIEQRYQGRLDQGTALSIRRRDVLAAY